jgi:hypothetical protein
MQRERFLINRENVDSNEHGTLTISRPVSVEFTREEMVIIFSMMIQAEAQASAGATDASQARAKKLLDINPRILQTLL